MEILYYTVREKENIYEKSLSRLDDSFINLIKEETKHLFQEFKEVAYDIPILYHNIKTVDNLHNLKACDPDYDYESKQEEIEKLFCDYISICEKVIKMNKKFKKFGLKLKLNDKLLNDKLMSAIKDVRKRCVNSMLMDTTIYDADEFIEAHKEAVREYEAILK